MGLAPAAHNFGVGRRAAEPSEAQYTTSTGAPANWRVLVISVDENPLLWDMISMSEPIRTRWMDPDFRRDPKTAQHCVICQRDLKPGQNHREVRWEQDRWEAIHPEDWDRAAQAPHSRDHAIESGLIGLDCARRLGLEWSAPHD